MIKKICFIFLLFDFGSYTFLSYPDGWRLRLSQILVLPHYQRNGHGQYLLNTVYDECIRRNCIEINIEDPAPIFQLLRDLHDVLLCKKLGFFQKQCKQ
jgi:histone acetyltransferase 1